MISEFIAYQWLALFIFLSNPTVAPQPAVVHPVENPSVVQVSPVLDTPEGFKLSERMSDRLQESLSLARSA